MKSKYYITSMSRFELYKHEASGVQLGKPLAFETVESFETLFPHHEPFKLDGPGRYLHFRKGQASMRVRASEEVEQYIRTQMMSIVSDSHIHFEVIDHENGWSLVVVSYNIIIGNRYLAYIKTDSIPK